MEQIKKYFAFSGRATRSEYWAVTLIALFGVFFALAASEVVTGISVGIGAACYLVTLVASIVGFVAVIATTIRRCIDAGINPWFTLATLLPYVAFVAYIVIGVLPSVPEVTDDTE